MSCRIYILGVLSTSDGRSSHSLRQASTWIESCLSYMVETFAPVPLHDLLLQPGAGLEEAQDRHRVSLLTAALHHEILKTLVILRMIFS